MDAKLRDHVETLLKKATEAIEAHNAMNFAQAACNAANAIRVMEETALLRSTTITPKR